MLVFWSNSPQTPAERADNICLNRYKFSIYRLNLLSTYKFKHVKKLKMFLLKSVKPSKFDLPLEIESHFILKLEINRIKQTHIENK